MHALTAETILSAIALPLPIVLGMRLYNQIICSGLVL